MMTVAALIQDDYSALGAANAGLLRIARLLGNAFLLDRHDTCEAWMALRRGDLTVAQAYCEAAATYDDELGGACARRG